MSTPVINAINNVNDSALNTLFQAVANNAAARESLSQSNRNIDAVASNVSATDGLGDNAGQDEAIRLCLCRRTGRDPANFPDTATDIVQNGTFRGEILGDATLSRLLSGSQPGMAEIASSATLSSELAASQTAMQKVSASQTAMQEVAPSQTAMQEVAPSQTAMQEVAASQTAMQEVAASQTAMQEVAASQTALEEVAASQTAGDAVASSGTAVSVFEAESASGDNSVPGPNNAPIYIAQLSGAGGAGGDDSGQTVGSGSPGTDTTFHESLAEGGDGGDQNNFGTAPAGRGIANPPDVLINSVTGGGSAGGRDATAEAGGDGGFVKALIMNPERDSLSLSIGNGGTTPGDFARDGEDGSATIFTPSIF